jgi:hypothetical protein
LWMCKFSAVNNTNITDSGIREVGATESPHTVEFSSDVLYYILRKNAVFNGIFFLWNTKQQHGYGGKILFTSRLDSHYVINSWKVAYESSNGRISHTHTHTHARTRTHAHTHTRLQSTYTSLWNNYCNSTVGL